MLAVIAAIALLAAGSGHGISAAPPDRSPTGALAEGPVTRADIEALRFSLGFRGYRMDEVDAVLDRLVTELGLRDDRIAELEQGAPPTDASAADREDWRQDDLREEV
ncbi:MAG: DivIVA domain-containing protein [Propionibacteriales bacterium]|nr:DivIVA domain-containing protein [Propionibacteriales bacterium]